MGTGRPDNRICCHIFLISYKYGVCIVPEYLNFIIFPVLHIRISSEFWVPDEHLSLLIQFCVFLHKHASS